MASVAIVFRKDKLNSGGVAPLHFRIIKHRKISYIASGLSIKESEWDAKNKKIKKGHKNSQRFNSLLSNKFTELQDKVFENETFSRFSTARTLKEKIFGKKPVNIHAFAALVIEKYKAAGQIGSMAKSESIMKKLEKYDPEKQLTFHDIDTKFLAKYEADLRSTHKNKTNTIHKDLKFFRKLFNDAYRQDVIEHQMNPFLKYQLKTEKTERVYLTEDELLAFEEVETTPGTRMELHKDMFVFASYTGGLRVSDMLLLQWKHFDGTNINFTIQKTGTQLSIKVPNKAIELLKKYKPKKNNGEAFIFPMLPAVLNLKSAVDVDYQISKATAYINKNLKLIAKKAEIEKNISFHISRHTWATRALRKGISIDKVSKLMGHSAIRETQIYAKVVSQELDKAMEVFND